MMDDDLLRAARSARVRLLLARDEVRAATDDFHLAIRHLHLGGASVREIATTFGLSHQRVHQLAGAQPESWRLGSPAEKSCSFCSEGENQVGELLAGPAVWICRPCITLAKESAAGGDGRDDRRHFAPVRQDRCRCSFCRRRARRATVMVAAGGERICGSCLSFCDEILLAKRNAAH